jgi:hypothetical protein
MNVDNRSANRIQRTLNESRKAFDDVTYPKLDITNFNLRLMYYKFLVKAQFSYSSAKSL